ncbi:protein FAR-RED IMPAIRED RESPONSE 1-like [Silene latifolia]|uniref:protein FAR-RED IMPAIRED RESPONSE 1-like n=1 Tax=Silene latifolia TaxID=37657 RepID=UPI003D787DDE
MVEVIASQSISEISALNIDVPEILQDDVVDEAEVIEDAEEEEASGSSNMKRIFGCPTHLKPVIGMVFDTLELGIAFYEAYGKECGFVTRKDSQKNKQGVTTHKTCLCNKAGKCEAKGKKHCRQRTRVGCLDKINFKRIANDKYQIYGFVEGHNHMPATPLKMVHLTQTRELNIVHKKMIVDNSKVKKGPVMTYRMFKEYVRGYQNVGALLENFKNFSRDIKKFLSEGDAQMLIEHFMKRTRMCPSFYFDFEVDVKEGRLKKVFKDKVQHRYCMWHILKKLPEKVGPVICRETEFLKEINSCVWGEDVEPAEFKERWTTIVEAHGLSDNEWLQEKYGIRQFWIPAYFHLEKHAAETYTPRIFEELKVEIKAACFTCAIGDKEKDKNHAIIYIDVKDRERKKDYKVGYKTAEVKLVCNCKKFERHGILCRHILCVLKDYGFEKIPSEYLLNRWSKLATCQPIFNFDGQLLADCRSVDAQKNKLTELWSEMFTCVSLVEQSPINCDELLTILRGFKERVLAETTSSVADDGGNSSIGKKRDKNTEIGMLLGTSVPSEITILPPRQCKNKGSGKRMISQRERAGEVNKKPLRRCKAFGQMANHDSRNCD